MSTEKDTINDLGSRYGELYTNNSTFFNDEISRSYSAGIDESNVSPNLLRVYSRNNLYSHGSLRVRSSPSSPNRLSRLQCMTPMHKKWSALAKVNISTSSELELPNSQISQNSHKSCDFSNLDKLDLPSCNLLLTSTPSSRDTSSRNLQCQEEISIVDVKNELHPFSKTFSDKLNNHLIKQTSITVEDENSDNSKVSSYHAEQIDSKSQKFSFISNKSSLNPINFKKVLRDRYLSSQRNSKSAIYETLSPSLSSHNAIQNKPEPLNITESISSESEDHNFKFIQDSDVQSSQEQTGEYRKKLSFDIYRTRNALSLDLININMPKKYRIKSNNSTVSSMSGIESESDPFSPASTEICSPLLKLNLPYRNNNIKDTESTTRTLIPSSSLSALSTVTETEHFYVKSQESISVQRFFPDTMKISDFNPTKSSENESHFSQNVQRHLALPDLINSRNSSKSSSTSIEILSTLSAQTSNSLSPIYKETPNSNIYKQSSSSLECPIFSPSFNTNDVCRISNSRSMDHISSYLTKRNEDYLSKNIDNDVSKQSALDKSEDENYSSSSITHNLRRKSKSISNTTSNSKKPQIVPSSANQRQCNVCGRHFNRSDMLARHMRVHTGHKPFECTICGQSFSRSDHLNTHLRIHSGEKPYRCSICSYSACRRDMITRHLRVHKRKGDILIESSSSLVVNINKQKIIQHKKNNKLKSQSSLNLDPDNNCNDMKQSISSLFRSRSCTDTDQYIKYKEHDKSFVSESPIDSPVLPPRTFANISISISQPTPRGSFSIPMETQNY